MGLRCLLGHDFGEREVERERREAGDEVVVVYRTVENCRRCGERRVVSENKEVRSIREVAGVDAGADRPTDPADAPAERADDPTAGTGRPPASVGRAEPDRTSDDRAGRPADGAPTTDDAGTSTAAGSLVEAAESVGVPGSDGTDDDAVIITGGSDDGGTGAGGEGDDAGTADDRTDAGTADDRTEVGTAREEDGPTPEGGVELLGNAGDAADVEADAADDDGTDGDGWPTTAPDTEDEGYDAVPHDDTGTDVEFGGGFAPRADGDEAGDAAAEAETGVGPVFVRAEGRSDADADGPTELRCPNCGTTRTAAGSSLRGGDICPDCRKGYVAERAVEE
ncbi:MAG: hypothetical protein ABEJ81_04920 [Haloferacaceae archaeon]